MTEEISEKITRDYLDYVGNKEFACIAAKAALGREQIKCLVCDHMACPKDDFAILNFLYAFIEDYKASGTLYHSAAVIFTEPYIHNEDMFDDLLWKRLQALSDMDALFNNYDSRVSNNPDSSDFSFSIKEEAFFIIGLHPQSSRKTRQFKYPALIFNPHLQFEQLRQTPKYAAMKSIVRKRDVAYSGSVNPMLEDYGKASEVYQYSGRKYTDEWKCPLKVNHAAVEHNTTT